MVNYPTWTLACQVHTIIYIHTVIQWNFSNQDTNGAEESAIVSEVSSFQRLSKSGTWGGKRCPV